MLFRTILTIILCFAHTALYAQGDAALQKERSAANSAASKALSELSQIFNEVEESNFSSEPTTEATKIGRISIPVGTPKVVALRNQIQTLIAKIDLAQDYPATEFKGQETIDELIKGKDYFGTSATQNIEAFEARQAIMEKLFADEDLQLGNRLFGLMQTGKDTHKITATKWIQHIEKMAGPHYLGTTLERQPTTQGRSLKAMTILRGVSQGSDFKTVLEDNQDIAFLFKKAYHTNLKKAVTTFAKTRFDKGGMLRDWCLPMASAASRLYPELNRDTIGVTTLAEMQKTSLAHARAITKLIELIDEAEPDAAAARETLQDIVDYQKRPFYIGSTEIREPQTLKVPPHGEVELLLAKADFFGPDGHRDTKTYQERSDHLDGLFLKEGEFNNLDLLIALKTPGRWLDYFDQNLFGGKEPDNSVFFYAVENNHRINLDHLKVIFLARSILPSENFSDLAETNPETEKRHRRMLLTFGDKVKQSASTEFRNYSKEWTNVQNAFLEIGRGFERLNFERLKVTTSNDLEIVKKDYESALYGRSSVADDLLSLLSPTSPDVIPSLDHMTSPKLSRRVGRFDQQISPQFAAKVNEKLASILQYRSYGLAAIDTLDRPDLQVGRIMTHFAVSDYRIPGDDMTNTVMHDMICGAEGGFGGLGQLFRPDAQGYLERESILDAIATSENLDLGETLLKLAININRDGQISDADIGRAAKRWITFFRKSQANAQFHAVPEVLNQAIRGTFLSRIVFQSESFQKALENSKEASVGSPLDISRDLEDAVSSQVRKLQSMLSRIDPETASNRNIDETADEWQDLKVWYLESTKWLESIIEDPLMVSEISRVRTLNRKVAKYGDLCPEVIVFKKDFQHFGGEVYSANIPPTLGLARFAMEKVIKLEPDLDLPFQNAEEKEVDQIRQLEFGKRVSRQFLNDLRNAVKEAGFVRLSESNNPDDINREVNAALPHEAKSNVANPTMVKNRAAAIEEFFDAATARAISRVEAGQPSDFRTLVGQSVRAAKVDRVISDRQNATYRVNIEPSLIIRDWVDREQVEIMTAYRTLEVSAEAKQMTNMAKEERRSLIEVQKELEVIKADSYQKVELLQKWMDEADSGTNVEVVLEDILAMRSEITTLRREVALLKDTEALTRARAATLSQQLFQIKQTGIEKAEHPEPYTVPPENVVASAPKPQPKKTYTSYKKPAYKKPTYKKPTSSPSRSRSKPPPKKSSGGNFFQRLFGRR